MRWSLMLVFQRYEVSPRHDSLKKSQDGRYGLLQKIIIFIETFVSFLR